MILIILQRSRGGIKERRKHWLWESAVDFSCWAVCSRRGREAMRVVRGHPAVTKNGVPTEITSQGNEPSKWLWHNLKALSWSCHEAVSSYPKGRRLMASVDVFISMPKGISSSHNTQKTRNLRFRGNGQIWCCERPGKSRLSTVDRLWDNNPKVWKWEVSKNTEIPTYKLILQILEVVFQPSYLIG